MDPKPDPKQKPLAEMTGPEILALAETEDADFDRQRELDKVKHLARQRHLKALAKVSPE